MEWTSRTELLLGNEGMARLRNARVLVVGLGGVGAYAAEQLCRAGVGAMTIVDGDRVEPTNKNRQLPALDSTLGQPKAETLASRFRDINPDLRLRMVNDFIREEDAETLLASGPYDYVVDAIDTLGPKTALLAACVRAGVPVVSSMGAGGRMDPSQVRAADISQTHDCAVARAVRCRLRRLGITRGFTAVFSPEPVPPAAISPCEGGGKKSVVGTISYIPPVFGCHCAAVVIRSLTTPSPTEVSPP